MRRRRLLTVLLFAPAAAVAVCWAVYWHRPAAILLHRSQGDSRSAEVRLLWLGAAGLHFERGQAFASPPPPELVLKAAPFVIPWYFSSSDGAPAGAPRLHWTRPRVDLRTGVTYLHLPYWLLQLLTLAPPIAFVWRRRRHSRRDAAGLCPSCGYDLRATPDRCPECGQTSGAVTR
jgi:hypothetical protein